MGYSAAEKRAVLRAVAADLRGPGADSEAEQLAATLQRVSDLYDPAEERSRGYLPGHGPDLPGGSGGRTREFLTVGPGSSRLIAPF